VYREPALKITFQGGLDENETPHITEAATGSYNFELATHQDVLIPRPAFDLKGTATNGSKITGFAQLVKTDGTQTTLVVAGTVVYKWDGTTFTSKGSVTADATLRDVFWPLGNYILLTDVSLNNVVKQWDGTSLTNQTTGLMVPLCAKYGIVFNGRVWLFNLKVNGTAYPHQLLACAFEDPTTFSISQRAITGTFTTGLEAFYMFTPDLRPINGVVLFQDVLVISTVGGRLFVLGGTDAKSYNWTDFYDGSAAVGDEGIVNVGNDVLYTRQGGNITALSAVQAFGDAKAEDLSRWIPKSVKNLATSIVCYDQTNQKVFFFTNTGFVLVFYKDMVYQIPGESAVNVVRLSPWSKYITQHPNNFTTAAVKYMYQPGTTDYSVFFGDSSGNIFDLNGTGNGDAGTYPIPVLRNSRLIDEMVLNPWPFLDAIIEGEVQYRRIAPPFDLSIAFTWFDEYNTSISVIPIKGPPAGTAGAYWGGAIYWGGAVYWGEGFSFANVVSHQTFSPTGKGPGFTMAISCSASGQFEIDNINLFK